MRRPFVAVCVTACTLLIAGSAAAQTTPQKADYVEQKTDSGQAVIFLDDPLKAGGLEQGGYIIETRGRFWRVGLLRPRLNFVPELLKSGESL